MNKYITLLLFAFAVVFSTKAQLVFEGQVFEQDKVTTLPFLNVLAMPSGEGTTTDIDGYFYFTTNKKVKTLTFSSIGFESVVVKVKNTSDKNMLIIMPPSGIQINETIVLGKRKKIKKDTAAITLYRNVVKNKKENRPKGLDSYYYKEHTKMEFDLYKYNPKLPKKFYMRAFRYAFDFTDTTMAGNWFVPGLLQEEISEVYYQNKPKRNKQIMHANMATGMDNLSASLLLTDVFEQINMYDNMIEAGGKPFASPFSPSGILTYRYFLSDSMYTEDSVKLYRLDFSPRNKHDIAFNGYAWIETVNFAITDMEFRIPTKANLNFISDFYVRQTFTKPDNEHWFLTAEEMHIAVNPFKNRKGRSILLKKRFRRGDIEINQQIPESIFEGENFIKADSIATRDKKWWKENRVAPLTEGEKNIFLVVDSIQNTKAYTNYKNAIYALGSGYLRFGRTPPIEIGQYYKFLSYNNIEGFRPKFGFRTNKYMSKKYQFTAYAAYGMKDKQWKHLLNLRFMLPTKNHHWHILEMKYGKDFTFLGTTDAEQVFNHDNALLSILRRRPLEKIMKIEEFRVQYEREWVNGFTTDIFGSRKTFYPILGTFEFNVPDGKGGLKPLKEFTTTEFGVNAHFEFGKNYFTNTFIRTGAGSKLPQVDVSYTLGLKDFLGGDHSYHKFKLRWFHRFSHKFGYSRYQVRAGYALGETPYPLLFMHQGNITFYNSKKAYSVMQEFEFASDRFAAFWIDHHFDGKILNAIPLVKLLRLRSIFLFKVLVSDIQPSNRTIIDMPTTIRSTLDMRDKVYMEMGFGIENILNVLRVDFVWRLTQRNKVIGGIPVDKFTIKFAIEPKL